MLKFIENGEGVEGGQIMINYLILIFKV